MPKKSSRPAPRSRKSARPAAARTAQGSKARSKARPAAKSARRPAKAIDPAAMMAAWQEAAAPSEGHRRLQPIVGTFNAKTTFWMAPGAPPNVSEAVSEHRWVLGNRYIEQVYRGTMMGGAFEGIGFIGYDNVQKKYVGTWMDSVGTGIMTSTSVGTPTAQAIQFRCQCHEPLVGPSELRAVARIKDHDHHTYEMFRRGPGGKEFRQMLIEYSRK